MLGIPYAESKILPGRSLQDHGLDCHAPIGQEPAISPAVVQAFQAGLVVADHPIPKGLAIHPGEASRLYPAHAV